MRVAGTIQTDKTKCAQNEKENYTTWIRSRDISIHALCIKTARIMRELSGRITSSRGTAFTRDLSGEVEE